MAHLPSPALAWHRAFSLPPLPSRQQLTLPLRESVSQPANGRFGAQSKQQGRSSQTNPPVSTLANYVCYLTAKPIIFKGYVDAANVSNAQFKQIFLQMFGSSKF